MIGISEMRWNAVKAKMGRVSSGVAGVALAGVLAMGLAGCSQGASSSASSSSSSSSAAAQETTLTAANEIDESLYDLEYTKRDKDASYDEATATKIALLGTSASVDGSGATAAGSTVTVSSEGVYLLSGELTGQVVVNAPEDAKVQLVLNGVEATNATGPAILVQQADKCFITLADGTVNEISDGASYADAESEANAAIYAACDLTLQGSGGLTVNGLFKHGVKSQDDLVITGGEYVIGAVSTALLGHDSLKVAGGAFDIAAGNDAMKSSKSDDESKGFVSIDGGTFELEATDKGIVAETYLRIGEGAVLDVTSGDDALHSNLYARIAGGEISIDAGDDALHADAILEVNGGAVDVSRCYEGYEAQTITINGGDTHIVASDDGMNASSGSSGADEPGAIMAGDGASHKFGMGEQPSAPPSSSSSSSAGGAQVPDQAFRDQGRGGGFGGGGMMDADENCTLTINGGTVFVEAGGDGLDSNGAIVINGGETYVSGPTSSADGALDSGTTITANGGTLIAVGSAGMAESFSDGAQPFAQASISGSANAELALVGANGEVIASFTPTKSYQNVVVTAPGLEEGGSYTLKSGASSVEITASTTATETSGFGFGGMGGQGGQMPGDARSGQAPDGGRMGERPQGGPSAGGQRSTAA